MKTTRLFTIITVIMIAATLTACGNAAVATTNTQDQPQVEPKQEVVAEPTAEVVEEQPEVTEEVAPAVEEQQANPEEATYEDKWDCTIGFFKEQALNMEIRDTVSPVAFVKWDCKTKRGQLLELGNEYDIRTGDVVIVMEFHNGDLKVAGDKLPEATSYFDFEGIYNEEYQFAQQYYEATELPSEPFVFERKPYDDTDKYDFFVTFNPVQ